jgi:hypothetical protein
VSAKNEVRKIEIYKDRKFWGFKFYEKIFDYK